MSIKENTPENLILIQGFEDLLSSGVRSFTVENLAACLCMSKKTIYKFFATKEILIDKIVAFRLSQIEERIQEIMATQDNPVHQFLGVMEFLFHTTSKLKIERIQDLKTRYPKIWKRVENFRLERRKDFYEILSSAQSRGYVRQELDVELIATIYTNIINSTFQPEFFLNNSLTPKDVLPAYVDLVSGGLLSAKGQKFYAKIEE